MSNPVILPFVTFGDITTEKISKRSIFKGVMARGETSAWIAPPGGMKSALMTEASVCAAAGLDWRGKSNKERVAVAYFGPERLSGSTTTSNRASLGCTSHNG